jgi:putative PIN family toxin of toxin-antitoxin system
MTAPHLVVFDCVVFAQALINRRGPAAFCVEQVFRGRLHLHISPYILDEIREIPYKIPVRFGITIDRAAELADQMKFVATVVDDAPVVYTHPIDPDDSAYVNLAIATNSKLIISRDRHLLNLMDSNRPEGRQFHSLFPKLIVTTPDAFAKQLREEERQGQT